MERKNEREQLIGVKEAAEILTVSQNTVLRLIRAGELKACRIGKRSLRTSRAACEEYLRRRFREQEDLAASVVVDL